MPELFDESRTGRPPIQVVASLRGRGALIEQQDFGEIVAHASPRLVIGAGHGSWSANCNGPALWSFFSVVNEEADARSATPADIIMAADYGIQ